MTQMKYKTLIQDVAYVYTILHTIFHRIKQF